MTSHEVPSFASLLVCGVMAAHFLNESLNRHGLGSGLELYVATNTCGIIVWNCSAHW